MHTECSWKCGEQQCVSFARSISFCYITNTGEYWVSIYRSLYSKKRAKESDHNAYYQLLSSSLSFLIKRWSLLLLEIEGWFVLCINYRLPHYSTVRHRIWILDSQFLNFAFQVWCPRHSNSFFVHQSIRRSAIAASCVLSTDELTAFNRQSFSASLGVSSTDSSRQRKSAMERRSDDDENQKKIIIN